jgi:hypothetical protein
MTDFIVKMLKTSLFVPWVVDTQYSTLADAVLASVDKVLILTKEHVLTEDMSFPSTMSVTAFPGTRIRTAYEEDEVVYTFTLTINCPFDAGRYQVFDLSLGGSILGDMQVDEVYPEWFGAVGDATFTSHSWIPYPPFVSGTDDTVAFEAALALCVSSIHSPKRISLGAKAYYVTDSLTVNNTDVAEQITIKGQGAKSCIVGKIDTTSRAILEFIGTGNTACVWFCKLEDLTLRLTSNSNTGAYCLRVGDSRYFRAKNVYCCGYNCLKLKLASSTSYAQIATKFENCIFHTTDWGSDLPYDEGLGNASTSAYAVQDESGGAYCDTVQFSSCEFWGTVRTRGWCLIFNNCLFGTPEERPSPCDIAAYVYIGSAVFQSCMFESYGRGIYIGSSNHVWSVSVRDSSFQGKSVATYGIYLGGSGATPNMHNITVENCKFANHVTKDIYNSTNCENLIVRNSHNYNSAGLSWGPPTVALSGDGFNLVYSQNTAAAMTLETIETEAYSLPASGTQYLALNGMTNSTKKVATRAFWIVFVEVIYDDNYVAGTASLQILKNGVSQTTIVYPTGFTITDNTGTEAGIKEVPKNSMWFEAGDTCQLYIAADADWDPNPAVVKIILHIAY